MSPKQQARELVDHYSRSHIAEVDRALIASGVAVLFARIADLERENQKIADAHDKLRGRCVDAEAMVVEVAQRCDVEVARVKELECALGVGHDQYKDALAAERRAREEVGANAQELVRQRRVAEDELGVVEKKLWECHNRIVELERELAAAIGEAGIVRRERDEARAKLNELRLVNKECSSLTAENLRIASKLAGRRVVPGRSDRLERERDDARAKLREAEATRNETSRALIVQEERTVNERTLADRLAEALEHMQHCRPCSEESWETSDDEGRAAVAALAVHAQALATSSAIDTTGRTYTKEDLDAR